MQLRGKRMRVGERLRCSSLDLPDYYHTCRVGEEKAAWNAIGSPVLLAGVAAVHHDGKLLWDGEKGEITNVPEANKWIKPTYREGWELTL